MIDKDKAQATFNAVWPDYQEYMAMSESQRYAYTLQELNATRLELGAEPLDHIPTESEVKHYWTRAAQAYQARNNTWRARWNRFLNRLLGPAN